MGKKIAIGCLVIVLLLVAALGIGGYYVYDKFFAGFAEFVSEMQTLEESIENKSDYSAPANEQLSDSQIEAFMQVQRTIEAQAGDQLRSIADELEALDSTANQDVEFDQLMKLAGEGGDVLLATKRAQVEGLNQLNMSADEYNWIRGQVFAALHLAGFEAEDLPEGANPNQQALQANAEKLAPHIQELQEYRVALILQL